MTTDQSPELHLGAGVFSFTREILRRELTFTECMMKLGSLPAEQTVEILDAQHIRSYPHLSAAAEAELREAVEESGVKLSLYDHEVDLGWVAGQPFDDDRIVEVVVAAMEIGAKLGFPLFRANMPNPGLLKRLLPHAERLDVCILHEIQTQTIEAPPIRALFDAFEDWQSPHVGFLQDLGAFTIQVPRAFLAYKAKTGVPDAVLEVIAEGFQDGRERADVVAEIQRLTKDPLATETANECFSMFGRTEPSAMRALAPYIRHVHTKFYEIVDGEEPCVPYAEVIAELCGFGYAGVLSSEWTGFNFIEQSIAFDQVKAQQEMITRLWDQQVVTERETEHVISSSSSN